MAHFEVVVERTVYVSLEIDAATKEEAEKRAREIIQADYENIELWNEYISEGFEYEVIPVILNSSISKSGIPLLLLSIYAATDLRSSLTTRSLVSSSAIMAASSSDVILIQDRGGSPCLTFKVDCSPQIDGLYAFRCLRAHLHT